jgi:hypothetical protein
VLLLPPEVERRELPRALGILAGLLMERAQVRDWLFFLGGGAERFKQCEVWLLWGWCEWTGNHGAWYLKPL